MATIEKLIIVEVNGLSREDTADTFIELLDSFSVAFSNLVSS